MKKIIALALAIITLATLATTTQAQSLTFDETVKYLNEKFKARSDETVSVTELGIVAFSYPSGRVWKYDIKEVEMTYKYGTYDDGSVYHQFWAECEGCIFILI